MDVTSIYLYLICQWTFYKELSMHRHNKVTRPKLLAKLKLFVPGTVETLSSNKALASSMATIADATASLTCVLCLLNHTSQLAQGVYGDYDPPVNHVT